MKTLFSVILTLFASVWIALFLRQDPGYAMVSVGQWTIETSFAVFLIALFLLFSLFYFLVRLGVHFWRSPALTSAASRQWEQQRARQLFDKGLQQMAAGHAAEAEKMLLKGASSSETPAQHYLTAARASHQSSEEKWRRDLHLRKAEECQGVDPVTVQLTRAEFLLDDQKPEQARPLLESLRASHPRPVSYTHLTLPTSDLV